jgi:hypothetical protein
VGVTIQLTLPPQPALAAWWQPAVWICDKLEPQINADERRYCNKKQISIMFWALLVIGS